MIKYGLISEVDARCLEKTMDLIVKDFPKGNVLHITEVGVYGGDTANGIDQYLICKHDRMAFITGVDNNKDGEPLRFDYDNLIIGNSNEVYNQIEDNSQHLIFIDGCHCFAHVVSDFFCYADKVKVGGFLAFHDTGKHIKPFKDFQHGQVENPDAYISVRKALIGMGILDNMYKSERVGAEDGLFQFAWQLIFDEADENNEAGGITVFKKLY